MNRIQQCVLVSSMLFFAVTSPAQVLETDSLARQLNTVEGQLQSYVFRVQTENQAAALIRKAATDLGDWQNTIALSRALEEVTSAQTLLASTAGSSQELARLVDRARAIVITVQTSTPAPQARDALGLMRRDVLDPMTRLDAARASDIASLRNRLITFEQRITDLQRATAGKQ